MPARSLRSTLLAMLATLAVLTASCGDDAVPLPAGIEVGEGFGLAVVATGFERPTQLARTPNGDIVLGEIVDGENDATGRVTLVDGDDLERRVTLFEGLDKPTGVAVIGDRIWVMQRTSLWSAPFDDFDTVGPLEPVLTDLPSNGRSEGTLTVTPEGSLLFDTSGSRRGAQVTEGSGTLFVIDEPSADPTPPRPIASGFKHAYAHVFATDGRLFSVEMTDGNFDGSRASDELVVVEEGGSAGWPLCVDDNRPVVDLGGDEATCADTFSSHALFGAGATPTSIALAPWDPDTMLVTLWIPGLVVAVPTAPSAEPHVGEAVVSGIESPQALLANGDEILIADHESGTIFALTG